MSSTADVFFKATLVGVGGTILLDLHALMMSRILGVPATNWAMVGRWFGNMAHGQFVQVAMSEAAPFKGELAEGADPEGHRGATGPLSIGFVMLTCGDTVSVPPCSRLHLCCSRRSTADNDIPARTKLARVV